MCYTYKVLMLARETNVLYLQSFDVGKGDKCAILTKF